MQNRFLEGGSEEEGMEGREGEGWMGRGNWEEAVADSGGPGGPWTPSTHPHEEYA